MVSFDCLATSRNPVARALTLLTWEDRRLNNPGGHSSGAACGRPDSPNKAPFDDPTPTHAARY